MKENDISMQTNDNNNEDDYQGTLESLAYLEEEKAQRLVDFLEYSGIKDAQAVEDETNGTYEVQVPSKEFEQAENLYRVFSDQKMIFFLQPEHFIPIPQKNTKITSLLPLHFLYVALLD